LGSAGRAAEAEHGVGPVFGEVEVDELGGADVDRARWSFARPQQVGDQGWGVAHELDQGLVGELGHQARTLASRARRARVQPLSSLCGEPKRTGSQSRAPLRATGPILRAAMTPARAPFATILVPVDFSPASDEHIKAGQAVE